LGHDAIHVWERGQPTAQDSEIFRAAAVERRVVITCDLDFGDLAAATGRDSASIILLRLSALTVPRVMARLSAVLPLAEAALHQGAIVVIEEARHRVRRLPL
jgi:predicted nuclease of predicted toxin-antitoxin system